MPRVHRVSADHHRLNCDHHGLEEPHCANHLAAVESVSRRACEKREQKHRHRSHASYRTNPEARTGQLIRDPRHCRRVRKSADVKYGLGPQQLRDSAPSEHCDSTRHRIAGCLQGGILADRVLRCVGDQFRVPIMRKHEIS